MEETVNAKAERKLKEIEEFDKKTDEGKSDSNKSKVEVAVDKRKPDLKSALPPLVQNHDSRIVYPFVGVYLFLKSNVIVHNYDIIFPNYNQFITHHSGVVPSPKCPLYGKMPDWT